MGDWLFTGGLGGVGTGAAGGAGGGSAGGGGAQAQGGSNGASAVGGALGGNAARLDAAESVEISPLGDAGDPGQQDSGPTRVTGDGCACTSSGHGTWLQSFMLLMMTVLVVALRRRRT